MEYDCPDRTCFVENRLMDSCIIYNPNSTANCSIPCQLESCTFHVVNEILCPIYHCTPFTTTTLTTTTASPDAQPHYDGWAISSFILNAMMLLIIILICVKYVRQFLKKQKAARERAELLDARQRLIESALVNPLTGFSISDMATGAATGLTNRNFEGMFINQY